MADEASKKRTGESSEQASTIMRKNSDDPGSDPEAQRDDVPESSSAEIGDDHERDKKAELLPEKHPLSELEKGLVGWDSHDDPSNPRNFTDTRKWCAIGFIGGITFLSNLSSSAFAPGISFVNKDFNNSSQILGSLSISIFVLGYSIGPLFLSPLSEIYGRRIVLNLSNIVFCAFNLGCALAPNLAGLIVMRLLAGVGGSACLTLGAGIISDLFMAQQRGRAMSMYSLGVMFGPVIGPICGGFIAQRAGWRWNFWVLLIAGSIMTGGIIIFNRETNPVVLLDWKTKRLRKEFGRPELRNILTYEADATSLRRGNVLKRGIVRPLKLLFTSPIVFLLSLYISFVFGLLFLLFTTITQLFIQVYGWSPEICGLAYIGPGIGFFIGISFVAKTSDTTVVRLTKKNKGVYEPEMRLPACAFFGLLIPISLFWYGWSSYKHAHWIVPIIGLLPFGTGMMGVFAPVQIYLVDSFPQYAASALAALTFLRCLFGSMLPLAGPSMYASLGLGWGNSLLGFVAVAMIPFPALIYKYGGYIRKKWPVNL
ncbi:major facilitator superfamily domain-containing protein [Diaporthe sp. PMI_573]|nr:major facilitator superfamily domain-containing protein [Diaporthaceae sp. PMI_573]